MKFSGPLDDEWCETARIGSFWVNRFDCFFLFFLFRVDFEFVESDEYRNYRSIIVFICFGIDS